MTTAAPRTVLETILDWSVDRPAWQRDALRRIVTGGTPNDAAIAELLVLCKKEHGAPDIKLVPVVLEASHLPANPANGACVTIASLADIVGVNQLAPGQHLSFDPTGLTIVYGPNGAGKSGYGRVLKRACRARKAGEIMPDAYQTPPSGKATANFSILKDGVATKPIAWSDSAGPHDVLSAISVFDRDCGSVHVQEKNEVAFRPFGLDIPDDLAGVCQKLKQLLAAEETQLNAMRHPVFATPTWKPSTTVGKVLSALAYNSDLTALQAMGEITPEERSRLANLREDLQKNPAEAAAAQRLIVDDLRKLTATLDGYAAAYSDAALQRLKSLADTARNTRAAATAAATKTFEGLSVAGVGGTAWRALWEAARRYAEHTAYPGTYFPHGDHEVCVLCHQPLTAEARTRLQDFETFIKADAEAQATRAESEYSSALNAFKTSKIDVRVIGSTRRRLAVQKPELARAVLRLIASADLRRLQCLASLSKDSQLELAPFTAPVKEALQAIETAAREYASQLDDAAREEGRAKLVKERDELADRDSVAALMDTIRKEVTRLGALRIVRRCVDDTATNAITKLGNDIADNVITPKMRDQFQSEIVSLAAEKVRVEIVRSGGQYGSPNYQVRLFANPKAKVHTVLSEGEQTCVALAAFLAELATASHKSALVFDDPVTSLDHRWRDKVAERLVEECKQRQIIVFTHDMVFVNDLNDKAVRQGSRAKLVSLSRGPSGTGIVADGLPWQHASLKDRIDKLEKDGRAARVLYDANDEERYRDAAIGIYNRLRASWERGLEDILFAGVILRHRDYIDAKNLKRVTAVDSADVDVYRNNFRKCSDLVEAHDPSRGRDAAVPPPDEIMADIKTLADWANGLRTKQNAVA
jgi:hypothetical protein